MYMNVQGKVLIVGPVTGSHLNWFCSVISVKIPFISSMKMPIKPACMIILKEDLGVCHLCISG